MEPPLPRGIVWLDGPEPGLLAPGCAWLRLPEATWSLQWLSATGLAGNSGGTASDSHRTSLDHRPFLTRELYPLGTPRAQGGDRDRQRGGHRGDRNGGGDRRRVVVGEVERTIARCDRQ